MNPFNYYVAVLKKYVEFSGRASRAEYWYFVLINVVISFAISWILGNLAGQDTASLVSGLYSLAVLLPSLAVSARRMHDIGKSGWWLLIVLVPLIGPFWWLYLAVQPSGAKNAYGAAPKA